MKSSGASVSSRIELVHGAYRIIAGELANECRAIAYLGARQVDTASGATVDEAVAAVKAMLDERMARRREGRANGAPSAAEFREALGSLPASQRTKVLPLLLAHGRMPEGMPPVQELMRRFDLDAAEIMAAYRRVGRSLATHLDFAPEVHDFHARAAVLATLATAEEPGQLPGKGLAMRLRPELVEALEAIMPGGTAPADRDAQPGNG